MMTGDNNKIHLRQHGTRQIPGLKYWTLIFHLSHHIYISSWQVFNRLAEKEKWVPFNTEHPAYPKGFNSSQISISPQAKKCTDSIYCTENRLIFIILFPQIITHIWQFFVWLFTPFKEFHSNCLFSIFALISHHSLIFHISRHLFTPVHTWALITYFWPFQRVSLFL